MSFTLLKNRAAEFDESGEDADEDDEDDEAAGVVWAADVFAALAGGGSFGDHDCVVGIFLGIFIRDLHAVE